MMPTTIAGIPCQVSVTHFEPYDAGSWDEPPSGGEIEFDVYDRKGYRAPWLERKVTEDDEVRVFSEYEADLQDMKDDARIEAYIDRRDALWATG